MLSNLMIGFLVGAGFGAWIYSKVIRSTGGNTKNAIVVAGIAGFLALAVVTILMGIIFKH